MSGPVWTRTAKRIFGRASAPASAIEGDVYYNTADNTLYLATATDTWTAVASGVKIGATRLQFIIDGGGSAITTGEKGHIVIPFDCTVTGWTLVADQSGSIVIDVWSDTYGNFPPTVADTIAGSEKPTLSTATKNQDNSLTTWTTSLSSGDILAFNVDSITTCTRVTLSLDITPT